MRRSYTLDLLRIFACLWVISLHWFGSTFPYYHPIYRISSPGPLKHIVALGFLGVDIFFVLSGAVIAKSMLNSSPKNFATNRLLRIYPEFLLAGVLTILVEPFALPNFNFRSAITSLTFYNFIQNRIGVIDTAWTLKYEFEFYFFAFLLLYLYKKRKKNLKVRNFARILHVWSCILFVVNVFFPAKFYEFISWEGFAPYFALGAALVIKKKNLFPVVIVSSFLVYKKMMVRISFLSSLLSHSILCFVVILVIVLAIYFSDFLDNFLMHFVPINFIKNLALSTYPMYILHTGFSLSLYTIFFSLSKSKLISLGFAFLILVIVSFISSKYYQPWVKKIILKVRLFKSS